MKSLIWLVTSLTVSGVLLVLMMWPETFESMESMPLRRTVFLPGDTTHGHYQIELDCEACHTDAFAGSAPMQAACEGCHAAELERVDDSHPQSKFTDPRNADRVARLDARWCVTCHQEHRPGITASMGLSLPGDYCFRCHENVGQDRPTHADLPFDGCASGGCHNFHDNQALYEDFLVRHRDEPSTHPVARVPLRTPDASREARGEPARSPLSARDHDAPEGLEGLGGWVEEWVGTAHAEAGINCGDCHAAKGAAWRDHPEWSACSSCHEIERDGFLAGRHGMRLAAGLPAMTPGEARLPMQTDSRDRTLDCTSCHGAHAFDTRRAAADACLSCHADEHSLAWEASPHAALWHEEQAGRGAAGSGVSCATCHLPRLHVEGPPEHVVVAHNQNDSLRPNEKMIRSSCMACHGLGFSLDALADPALVTRSFRGRPARATQSIHFATVLRFELEGRPAPFDNPKQEQQKERGARE